MQKPSCRGGSGLAFTQERDRSRNVAMQDLTPSRARRETFLSFQPPAVGEEEIGAVAETLRSGWLTSGPRAEELERRFAEYVGARHAVALSSGTAAMHLSLVAAGVGPGDEVITTPITWPATKNVAAGEGGMVTTDDDELAGGIRELRLMRRGDGSLYDVRTAGFKANLSDVLAAVALCQLDKLERHAEIRRSHVERYDAAVADLPGIEPLARDARDTHALHLYVVRIDPELAGADRDAYQRALRDENIGTSIHFLPVHRLTYYREAFPDHPPLPVAERAGAEVLSLPLSPAHSEEDVEDAIDALRRVHTAFTR